MKAPILTENHEARNPTMDFQGFLQDDFRRLCFIALKTLFYWYRGDNQLQTVSFLDPLSRPETPRIDQLRSLQRYEPLTTPKETFT